MHISGNDNVAWNYVILQNYGSDYQQYYGILRKYFAQTGSIYHPYGFL